MNRRHAAMLPSDDITGAAVTAEIADRVARLRRLRHVPDDVLAEVVAAGGLTTRPFDEADPATNLGAADPDRELAARLCAGCPVQDECLELDHRWMADQTLGVFAGLTEGDRRVAYPLWLAERRAIAGAAHPARPADASAPKGGAR